MRAPQTPGEPGHEGDARVEGEGGATDFISGYTLPIVWAYSGAGRGHTSLPLGA